VKIDAIEQRSAHFAQITLNDRAGAAAFVRGVRKKSTRAPVHVTNATLNMNPECRPVSQIVFLLTKDLPLCYLGNSPRRLF
jgi:hypothetical protein